MRSDTPGLLSLPLPLCLQSTCFLQIFLVLLASVFRVKALQIRRLPDAVRLYLDAVAPIIADGVESGPATPVLRLERRRDRTSKGGFLASIFDLRDFILLHREPSETNRSTSGQLKTRENRAFGIVAAIERCVQLCERQDTLPIAPAADGDRGRSRIG